MDQLKMTKLSQSETEAEDKRENTESTDRIHGRTIIYFSYFLLIQ